MFSIDGHTLSIIANDFVPIKPYSTQGTCQFLDSEILIDLSSRYTWRWPEIRCTRARHIWCDRLIPDALHHCGLLIDKWAKFDGNCLLRYSCAKYPADYHAVAKFSERGPKPMRQCTIILLTSSLQRILTSVGRSKLDRSTLQHHARSKATNHTADRHRLRSERNKLLGLDHEQSFFPGQLQRSHPVAIKRRQQFISPKPAVERLQFRLQLFYPFLDQEPGSSSSPNASPRPQFLRSRCWHRRLGR